MSDRFCYLFEGTKAEPVDVVDSLLNSGLHLEKPGSHLAVVWTIEGDQYLTIKDVRRHLADDYRTPQDNGNDTSIQLWFEAEIDLLCTFTRRALGLECIFGLSGLLADHEQIIASWLLQYIKASSPDIGPKLAVFDPI